MFAGSHIQIKIYDEEKKAKAQSLGGEELFPPGHSSRVYCVKFSLDNPNILYSGGWDMRVIRWDLRAGKPDTMGKPLPLSFGAFVVFAASQSSPPVLGGSDTAFSLNSLVESAGISATVRALAREIEALFGFC